MSTVDPLRSYLEAAREGDDVAVRELVLRTQSAVTALCRTFGSPVDADDLTQETYLRAFRSLDSYRGESPVKAWLLSIARHVCADHVRRQTRYRSLRSRLQLERHPASGEPHVGYGELFAELTPERREAFVLTQIVGLSYDDAATVVGCPVGTIRSRVARARADLSELVRRSEAS